MSPGEIALLQAAHFRQILADEGEAADGGEDVAGGAEDAEGEGDGLRKVDGVKAHEGGVAGADAGKGERQQTGEDGEGGEGEIGDEGDAGAQGEGEHPDLQEVQEPDEDRRERDFGEARFAGPEVAVHLGPRAAELGQAGLHLARSDARGGGEKALRKPLRGEEQHAEKQTTADDREAEPVEERVAGDAVAHEEVRRMKRFQRAGAGELHPGEAKDAPEQERKHVAGFLEDDQRERQRAGEMPAIPHEIGLGDVAHFRGEDEIQHAGDEDEAVGFGKGEVPTFGMSCWSRRAVSSVSGTTMPRLSAIQRRSQLAKMWPR